MRRQLEMQADRIEAVLASHKVQGRVWGGTVAPRAVRFQVMTSLSTKLRNVTGLSDEMAMALGVPAVRMYRERETVIIEVPRSDEAAPLTLSTLQALLRDLDVPTHSAVLGQGADGKPVLLRITSTDVVHVLVSGITGSGKTELMRSMLASLADANPAGTMSMLLIDTKGGRGFRPLEGREQVVGHMVTEPGEAAVALEWAAAEMDDRHRDGRSTPAWIIAIDELADIAARAPEALPHIARIGAMGRAAGVHLLAGTQRPAASVISGLLKANFPVRIVGQVASPEDAKIASGIAGTGAEKLIGPGDFLLIAGGRTVRFHSPLSGLEDAP